MPELTLAELVAAQTTVFPDDGELSAISWATPAPIVELGDAIATHVKVSANDYLDTLFGRAPGAIRLMRKGPVSRGDLDALFERIGDSSGRILVSAPTRELAATAALLHAVECRKLPAAAAGNCGLGVACNQLQN